MVRRRNSLAKRTRYKNKKRVLERTLRRVAFAFY